MNKLWLLLPLALATKSVLAQSCVLTGNIVGLGNKPVAFVYKLQGVTHTDTVQAVQDHFTYTAKPSDDGLVMLRIVRSPFTYFWVEPGKLLVTGSATQPDKLIVTGTLENNAYSEYNRTVKWKYDVMAAKTPAARTAAKEQNGLATMQFIKQHPATRTSAFLLYWQTLINTKKPLAEYEQSFNQLTPAVRKSVQGQQLAQRLLLLRNQPTVGRPVPNFSIADTTGTKFSLTAYQGQYVMLDFWGHWCGPCIEAMPKVKALHTQYAKKLAIIGIAMEDADDVALWKQAIRKYSVPGLQLLELQADRGPVISGYNITAFPTYMLLDPKGALVMRTNDVDDITKKLASLGSL